MICSIIYILVALIAAKILYGIIKKKTTKVDFSGKTVWITGAASGIGQQMAYEFSKAGASLILSDLGLDGLKKVKDACQAPEKVTLLKMDMSNFEEIDKGTAEIIAKIGKDGKQIDIVIENAGISMRSEFVDFPF